MKRFLWVVLAFLALGAVVPGCQEAVPGDSTLGSFCARPANGDRFCVSSDQSPTAAWRKAAANGPAPIEMWALWPDTLTREQIMKSEPELRAWFDDLDEVLSFVSTKDAESYRASMDRIEDLLAGVEIQQIEALAKEPVDAIGRFKEAIADKAEAEKSPLVAEIATDKQAMAAVQAVFDKAKLDAAPLSSTYASLVTQFNTYRTTEAAETATYASLSQQASAASLAGLAAVEQAILSAAHDASKKSVDLTMSAMMLSAQIQMFEVSSQAAIAPHEDFLAGHAAALPDMTSDALRSLNAMLGYVQQRVRRSDATATSLLNGIAMRRKALELLASSPAKGPEVAQAQLAKAEAVFHAEASALLAAVSGAPPSSTKLKLPYLALRYDKLIRLLQMRPLCESPSSSWREAGCSELRESFGAARVYLKTTLPGLIRTGLSALRIKGADTKLLDAIQTKLDAGDVKGAALAHDAAVRGMEGT